ncbi:hypothetical protein EJ08DRAFT_45482 [Tothia fuscella]|uniref:Uncharacterized protein n=1 Tax=Tothia fuscella TaxID=1048955 RepID=A0A9P4NFH0_9PEZI|nr:hypothetical protein EJ08DRAFT_45482 [Tothia fuscella]
MKADKISSSNSRMAPYSNPFSTTSNRPQRMTRFSRAAPERRLGRSNSFLEDWRDVDEPYGESVTVTEESATDGVVRPGGFAPFMKLPLELREQIYGHYFSSDTVDKFTLTNSVADMRRFSRMLPKLLHIKNAKLVSEASKVYFESNALIIRLQRAKDIEFIPSFLYHFSLQRSSLRNVDIKNLFAYCTQDLHYFSNTVGVIGRLDITDDLPDLPAIMPNLHYVTLDIRQAMLFTKRSWKHLKADDKCKASPLLETLLQMPNLKAITVCLPSNVIEGTECQTLVDMVKEKSDGKVEVKQVVTEFWHCPLEHRN